MFRCGLISYIWAIALVKRRGRTEREKGGKGRREGREEKMATGESSKDLFHKRAHRYWRLMDFDRRRSVWWPQKTQQPSSPGPQPSLPAGFGVSSSSHPAAVWRCLVFLYFFILILTTGNEREILLKGVMSMSVSSPPVHVYTRSILWCKIWGKCESQNSTTFSLVFLGTFISQPTPNF